MACNTLFHSDNLQNSMHIGNSPKTIILNEIMLDFFKHNLDFKFSTCYTHVTGALADRNANIYYTNTHSQNAAFVAQVVLEQANGTLQLQYTFYIYCSCLLNRNFTKCNFTSNVTLNCVSSMKNYLCHCLHKQYERFVSENSENI